MDDKLLFFSNFMKSPKETGSVVPSSRFLIDKMLMNIDFKRATCIVEYGPGTGCVTSEILRRARKDARILCFEINKKFCGHLRKSINDDRVLVINDGAENVNKYLRKFKIAHADCVISGLPFTNLRLDAKHSIIKETKNTLRANGKFVTYEYILISLKKHLKHYFSKISMKFVPLNMPPCFVFVCEK